jgi:hypothetical protein
MTNTHLKLGMDGALHVPLDDLRTVSYATKIFISGEFPGSGFFPIASGKVGFLKEAIINNLSGIYPVHLRWADAATAQSGLQISGNAYIVDLIITSGMSQLGTYVQDFNPALGPYVSGICIVSGGAQLGGTATAVIQTDPQIYE